MVDTQFNVMFWIGHQDSFRPQYRDEQGNVCYLNLDCSESSNIEWLTVRFVFVVPRLSSVCDLVLLNHEYVLLRQA